MPTRLLLLLTFLAPPILAAEFHVATNGNDTNPGTRAQPFGTLERARDAVRTRKVSQSAFQEKITVWVHGGDYVRTNTLELATADSGTADSPILWQAAQGENVRLAGRATREWIPRCHQSSDPGAIGRKRARSSSRD